MNIRLELQYLPPLRWLWYLAQGHHLWLDDTETFGRQSYRNRCYLAGANGRIQLTVPVHESRHALPIQEVLTDNSKPWTHTHWLSICSAYGRSAYFEHYAPYFETKYKTPPTHLWDWNLELLQLLVKHLKLDAGQLHRVSEGMPEDALDLRNHIHPKAKYDRPDPAYRAVPYFQAFSDRYDFLPDLSGLDLLFNLGPEGKALLQRSVQV